MGSVIGILFVLFVDMLHWEVLHQKEKNSVLCGSRMLARTTKVISPTLALIVGLPMLGFKEILGEVMIVNYNAKLAI